MDSKELNKIGAGDKMRSWFQIYGRGLLGLLVLVLIVHDIFGAHGFLAMRHIQREIVKVKADLYRLGSENAELGQEVKELKSDPYKIEKIARDELGMVRPGEIIIKIPQVKMPIQNASLKP